MRGNHDLESPKRRLFFIIAEPFGVAAPLERIEHMPNEALLLRTARGSDVNDYCMVGAQNWCVRRGTQSMRARCVGQGADLSPSTMSTTLMPRDIMSHMAFVMLDMVHSPCTHATESGGKCLACTESHTPASKLPMCHSTCHVLVRVNASGPSADLSGNAMQPFKLCLPRLMNDPRQDKARVRASSGASRLLSTSLETYACHDGSAPATSRTVDSDQDIVPGREQQLANFGDERRARPLHNGRGMKLQLRLSGCFLFFDCTHKLWLR
jgi:hypothetical protein